MWARPGRLGPPVRPYPIGALAGMGEAHPADCPAESMLRAAPGVSAGSRGAVKAAVGSERGEPALLCPSALRTFPRPGPTELDKQKICGLHRAAGSRVP